MNNTIEYWREKWNKAADHSKATDRSRLFKKPEQESSLKDPYEIGPTIPLEDFVKSDGSDCGELVSQQLKKINVFDYSEYSEVWNPDTKRFDYSKILIGMYYGEGNVWKRKKRYTSIDEVSKGKKYLIEEIDKKRAIKVMIDYTFGQVGGANPYGGDHAITIVGYGKDIEDRFYLRFYDHGTKYNDLGTHPKNRLYWNEELKVFRSNNETQMTNDNRSFSNGTIYTITHVRLNRE